MLSISAERSRRALSPAIFDLVDDNVEHHMRLRAGYSYLDVMLVQRHWARYCLAAKALGKFSLIVYTFLQRDSSQRMSAPLAD